MSIVTFWNNGREQTGKTISMVAIATYMAIEHNRRILVISTGYKDETLNNCFWKEKKKKKNMGIFGPNNNIAMEDGIEGLAKLVKSSRIQPEMITNYTKIIFKDRLEILKCHSGGRGQYDQLRDVYPEIINDANKYYDLVLVDLDKQIGEEIENKILKDSDLIVASIGQRLASIDDFIELKKNNPMFQSSRTLILIGRYDKFSKYNIKNISRYMKERNNVLTIPYNTLFFEACDEAKVPDLFLRIRQTNNPEDRNSFFLSEVKRVTENIIYRLQDLQRKV